MRDIKVFDDYNLFKKHTFSFEEGYTCLVGKNGSGKSTLLKEIREVLDKKSSNIFYYANEDSEKRGLQPFLDDSDMHRLIRNFQSSEGQNIYNNFSDITPEMGAFIRRNIKNKSEEVFILLDGLDSGLSIDNIYELKNFFINTVVKDCIKENIKPYLIISANNFEFCKDADCIRVSDAKHFKPKTYEEFRKMYIK